MQEKIRRPLQAIRQECLECSGYKPEEVLKCKITECSLYPFRMGNRSVNGLINDSDKLGYKNTPLKSIKEYCLRCCNNQPKEVRDCTCNSCTLFNYRLGNNPNRAGIGNVNNIKTELK